MKRPNILYMMADQYNANCLSIAGSQVRTPHLDQLAEEGVLFNKAYCNNPVCSPSRCTFITGQYPHTHGILGNYNYDLDDRNDTTLPAVFRRMGFQTAIIGKSHMVGQWDREGFEYIRYSDLIDCDANDPLQNHYFKYLYDHQIAHLWDLGTLKPEHPGAMHRAFDSQIPERHSLETWTGNEATAFLNQRDGARPFFMHLSFQRPHEPLTVPYDTGLLYDPKTIVLPDSARDLFENRFASKPKIMRDFLQHVGGYPYIPEDKADLQRQMAYYYSLITRIDEQIGRVIQALKDQGEYDNTVIVFTADHGDFAGEHGIILKNAGIYESIHRIPFLVKYPGCPQNKVVEELIESVDMYPTLCELGQVPVPPSVEGKSVLPIIEHHMPGKQETVCEWDFPRYNKRVTAVRTPEYRLVYFGSNEGGELYDIRKDPGELNNVYDEPEYREIRMQLLQSIMDHVNLYNVKSTFGKDRELRYKTRNCMTKMLHFEQKTWDEVGVLYQERQI